MKIKITYDNYSRDELIELVTRKNRKIDSQRSMLNQLRIRREKLQSKSKEIGVVIKENAKLKADAEKCKQRIKRLMESGRGKTWSMKEQSPVIINSILGYHKLRQERYVTNNEMAFLILAYQKELFRLSDIQAFNQKWGRNPDWNWRSDFRECCEAGFFYSHKINRRTYYFLSLHGRERFENLLKSMFIEN
ncbi:hypothetical protein [Mucilaginibacter sp.]|jgi:hypothetical protein|uniref:hypothetical protein n=1 Tax=Mucilaginibacter sp. TaxID=1882438 RepID=UPI002BF4FAA5|nr:hypothetical protein [Mucilaginibacter sp.]HTI60768.1 hypothetical protein [Mucilaginibacter sp.]